MENKSAIVPKRAQQSNIRLPDGMRERLKREAAKEGRTLNTEVARRLEKSLDESDENSIAALREFLEQELADLRREISKLREDLATKR